MSPEDTHTNAGRASSRPLPTTSEWKQAVANFQHASSWRATWQILNTFVPYALVWYLMYLSLGVSIWLALPLAVLAGALLVRVFIIFHDCGHDSFFRSRLANNITGFCAGVLVFTPYHHWRWEHAVHHATAGDLNRRGIGDIWTMTVQEYTEASRGKRFAYRLARNPFLLFVVAPVYLFLFRERFPVKQAGAREKRSVWWVNLAIAGMVLLMGWAFGFVPYLILMLTAISVAGISGVWLFYVQHQFEDAYWARGEDWDYTAAALWGSSYYKLPAVLRWFSGNIGYHHVHHLSPRIPNYNLGRCHESAEIFREVKPLRLLPSLRSLWLHLWDEQSCRLVSFAEARRSRRAPQGR
ncbi:MAG: fatty acid desaturase [Planctomycetes bacterium]|nr:fatty acid desaturase [Planctomycetota bacterium]